MENINRINGFGGYHVNNGQMGLRSQNDEQKETEKDLKSEGQNREAVSADDYFKAMNLAGSQFKAFISKNTGVDSIEKATELLGEDRTSSIEAMMAEFENGVNDIADIIDEEFGDIFSTPEKNALAAKIFAQG